jgi:hypothetical protein
MLREQLIKKEIGRGTFRWRSHKISRIEGLSDAVFGFAITLLVVSLEALRPLTNYSREHFLHGSIAFISSASVLIGGARMAGVAALI